MRRSLCLCRRETRAADPPDTLLVVSSRPEPSAPFEAALGVWVLPLRTPTLPPATRTNCVVVDADTPGGVYVIDPASPWPEPRAELDAWLLGRGLTVEAILLTHHHHDHVSGAAHLAERTGAPVMAHAINIDLVDIPIARTLADGEGVGSRLRAVFTPGHAPGHLAFHDAGSGVVIAGDMVAGTGTIVVAPPEGHMGTYLASLQRLKDEAPTALIPAHGPLIEDPQGHLDTYIRHRLWREERIFSALPAADEDGGPVDLLAVTRVAYTDVPVSLHPLAAFSARAHLDHLVELSRAAVSDSGLAWRRTG